MVKDLHLKLIMETPRSGRKGSGYKRQRPWSEFKTFQSLKGIYLNQTVEDTHLHQDANHGLCELSEFSHQTQHADYASETTASKPELVPEAKGGLIPSLQPLRIHYNPSQPPRAPTLQECEVIIRQLYNANSLQSQEILRIKAVLKDIVFNKRITPENYILTKAYLANDKRVKEPQRFPKLPCAVPRGQAACQANMAESVILPALKQSLGASFSERQRRTRAAQKSRFRKPIT